ncbi:MAG: 3'(2'),5'-bisphosphate nucleotidase [Alphaproteobacteria bacterium]|nr:3'(2'),5'-bisphosphate nucleotidase [Alphaproteobacteria bacterium]
MTASGSFLPPREGSGFANLSKSERSEDSDWLANLTQAMAEIAVEAGVIVMRAYAAGVPIRKKHDQTPVCDADEQSEAVILAALRRLYPTIPIIAEEIASCGAAPCVERDFFLVDPLDGTQEFAQRNGEFTINIAFIRDSKPLCGVIFAPAQNRLWMASPGHAEETYVAAGQALPGPENRLRMHIRSADRTALLALTSRSNLNVETESFLSQCAHTHRSGFGSALKFGLLASGEADFYPRFGPTMEWDTAAGDAILRAAGGRIITQMGEDLRYGKSDQLYRNPNFLAFGDPRLMDILTPSPMG